jgi:hypothetical protein
LGLIPSTEKKEEEEEAGISFNITLAIFCSFVLLFDI